MFDISVSIKIVMDNSMNQEDDNTDIITGEYIPISQNHPQTEAPQYENMAQQQNQHDGEYAHQPNQNHKEEEQRQSQNLDKQYYENNQQDGHSYHNVEEANQSNEEHNIYNLKEERSQDQNQQYQNQYQQENNEQQNQKQRNLEQNQNQEEGQREHENQFDQNQDFERQQHANQEGEGNQNNHQEEQSQNYHSLNQQSEIRSNHEQEDQQEQQNHQDNHESYQHQQNQQQHQHNEYHQDNYENQLQQNIQNNQNQVQQHHQIEQQINHDQNQSPSYAQDHQNHTQLVQNQHNEQIQQNRSQKLNQSLTNRQFQQHHIEHPDQSNDLVLPPSSEYFQDSNNHSINQEQKQEQKHNYQQQLQTRRLEYIEKREQSRQPYALYRREEQLSDHPQQSAPDQSVEDLERSKSVIEEERQITSDMHKETANANVQTNIVREPSPISTPPNQSQYTSNISSTTVPLIPLVPPSDIEPEPQVVTQTTPSEVEVEIPPHDDFQVMVLPQGLEPTSIGNMYSSAFQQRREINRKMMMQLLDKRNSYYLNHVGVFDHIRLGLRLRIKNSREAIDSFKQFFKEQIGIYNDVIASMKNVVELRNKTQTESLHVHWSTGITEGIYKNIEDQSEILDMMTSYKTLTNQNFIQQMEQAWRDYERALETLENKAMASRKEFSKFEEKIVDMQKDVHKKFKKEQKNPDKKNKGYDLAQQEVVLFREMKIGKDKLTKWGDTIIQWWEEQISQQIKLLTRIKELVNNFVDLTNKIHVISQHIRSRSSAWNLESVEEDVLDNYEFENIVCLTDIDFVRGSLQTYNRMPKPNKISIADMKVFSKIEHQQRIMGKRDIIIECLIAKEFKCKKVIPGKEQVEKVRVVATIDDNLLVIDFEEKTFNTKLKELLNTRPEASIVKVNYKKKGWFIDDWEFLLLEFKSEDKAEEFMFFTETNSETKKEYVV